MVSPRLALVLAAGLVVAMFSSPTVAAPIIGAGSAQNRSAAGLARTNSVFSNNEVTGTAGVLGDGTLLVVIEAVGETSPTRAPTPNRTFSGAGPLTTIESSNLMNAINNNANTNQGDTGRLSLDDSSTDLFILNIAGMTALNGSGTTARGLTADHVLYNFNAAGGHSTFQVQNTISSALPAPSYSLNDGPGSDHREIIVGGRGAPTSVPTSDPLIRRAFDSGSLVSEPSLILLGAGLAGAVALGLWRAAATQAPPEF